MNSYIKNVVIILCVILNTFTHTCQLNKKPIEWYDQQQINALTQQATHLTHTTNTLNRIIPIKELQLIILQYLAYGVSVATFDTSTNDGKLLLQHPSLNPREIADFSGFHHPISDVVLHTCDYRKKNEHFITVDAEREQAKRAGRITRNIARAIWLIPSTILFSHFSFVLHQKRSTPLISTATSSDQIYQATAHGTQVEVTMNLQHALAAHTISTATPVHK